MKTSNLSDIDNARNRANAWRRLKERAFVFFIVAGLLLGIGAFLKPYCWATYATGTVTEKVAKTGSVPFKICVKLDGGDFIDTFTNSDDWMRGKFDSGTAQANLQVGERYKFKVSGRRMYVTFGYFSPYRNIASYTEPDPD